MQGPLGVVSSSAGEAGGRLPRDEGSRDGMDKGGTLQAELWASAEQIWAPGEGQTGWCEIPSC